MKRSPSEEDRLRLKLEIMDHPGELVRAYLGDTQKMARLLDVPEPTATEILDEGRSVTHKTGVRALEKLRGTDAPAFGDRLGGPTPRAPPEPRRGLISHDLHGPELGRSRDRGG